MQQIDSEDHEAKHSLNDDTPGENGRESAASAGNVVRNDRRLHTELGERKKKIVSNQKCGEWWRRTG